MNPRFAALLLPALFVLGTATVSGNGPVPLLTPNDDGTCGVKLVLKNPDLQAKADGLIHASGWFFIQFQAVGTGAENVKTFTFSFGKPLPGDQYSCQTPEWVTGAYIKNYRGDYDARDGFFVPINTTLVSDDVYGAAVHAYNAANQEIGRFWVKARVENGCQLPQCRDKTLADIIKNDKIQPWPRVLPGDGIQTNEDVRGLTVEFAENVRDVQAYLNGNETLLQPWKGVPLDDDAQPGNDATACGSQPEQICKKRVWGPAFQWTGKIVQNDVLRVVATDLNGNRVEKILHLLDPSQGGIVAGDEVNIDISVDNTTQSAPPEAEAEFRFKFISVSATEAHVNLPVEFPADKVEARFSPDHVVIKPFERTEASLIVKGKRGVNNDAILILAKPTWRSGGEDVTKEFPLSFVIGTGMQSGSGAEDETGNETATGQSGETGGDSPGLGPAALVVGFAAALAWVRGRRHG